MALCEVCGKEEIETDINKFREKCCEECRHYLSGDCIGAVCTGEPGPVTICCICCEDSFSQFLNPLGVVM